MALSTETARSRLTCSVERIDDILDECLREAEAVMTDAGVEAWLDGASTVCGLGRGTELVLIFLEEMPAVVAATDESVIPEVAATATALSRVPLGSAINPFLSTLPFVARRLYSADSLRQWFRLVLRMATKGRDGLPALFDHIEPLLAQLSIGGLANWIEFGLRAYGERPHRMADFFALQTADAHAALQRERHGTLCMDHDREFTLTLRALWGMEDAKLRPYSLAFDSQRSPVPHIDKLGLHLPDVLHDEDGVDGLSRYRAMIAHMAAHLAWSRPYLADNFSPFQHVAVEVFEDSRIEALAMARYPGLRRLWAALHPIPEEGACPPDHSPIRHRIAMLSRAILDPDHGYGDPVVCEYAERFRAEMDKDPTDRHLSTRLGVHFLKDIHSRDFHRPKVWFKDTIVPYRDDNRYLWLFLEEGKEDQFHSDHGTADPPAEEQAADGLLPPQHYPEWDQAAHNYRPDWATVYEAVAAPGDAALVDGLVAGNAALARQVRRLVDRLKPHRRTRIRKQKEGDELDLDAALGALIDRRAGQVPDPRVYQRHVPDSRDIATFVLLDLSQSLAEVPEGLSRPLIEVEREAVALLGWAAEALGDPFAVAGFSSDTRHKVWFRHLKRFGEPWEAAAKGRLAAITPGDSTRMGAGLRHAARYLDAVEAERKLLLVVSDGRPYDTDVDDDDHLKWDTHAAVAELKARGVTTFCMTLDPAADAYVADIFGLNGYAVVDQVARLPEKLTRMFMSLTAR